MKYRKKPVVIDAVKVKNGFKDLAIWCNGQIAMDGRKVYGIVIPTLEGNMTARIGDWIIKGVEGEFYPCKPEIFEKTYEPID